MQLAFKLCPKVGFEIEVSLTSLFVEVGTRSVFFSLERPHWAIHSNTYRKDSGARAGELFICGLSITY